MEDLRALLKLPILAKQQLRAARYSGCEHLAGTALPSGTRASAWE